MNKQQAINLLKNLEQSLDDYCELNDEGKTAFRMAITALNCSEFPNNSDTISRQAAISALDVLCQEHRYKIPGKRETYNQYNEAWQDALDRAEGAIFNLPSAQPEIVRCKDCRWKNKHFCNRAVELFIHDEDFCSWAERREE